MSQLRIRSLLYAGLPAVRSADWDADASSIAALNRMTDRIPGCSVEGGVQLEGEDLLGPTLIRSTCAGESR